MMHAIAQRNAPHERVCGDAAVVLDGAHSTLVVVADGLGHGPGAHAASSRAIEVATQHAELPVDALLRLLDRELGATRGAAVSIARVHRGPTPSLDYVGVGNVECRVRSSASSRSAQPIPIPGIVGRGLRRVRVWSNPLATGDVVVLFTDGLSSRLELDATNDLEQLVEGAIQRFARGTDDALVVALRVNA